MFKLLEQGATLKEIAEVVGVRADSVGAWLERRGLAAAAARKSTLDVYGCSHAEAKKLNGGAILGKEGSPSSLYRDAMRGAERRGIAWEFTFPEWMRVWGESGKFHLRGQGPGDFCMARHGDVGPYCADNVSIITASQNAKDRWANKPLAVAKRLDNGRFVGAN